MSGRDIPNGQEGPRHEEAPASGSLQRPGKALSHYEIFGPFELPLGRDGAALDAAPRVLEQFWGAVNERESGLGGAYGCFVFSVCGNSWRQELPWYVGRADRKPFLASSLDEPRVAIYNEVLARVPHVSARLYLLSRMTPAGRFSKPGQGAHSEIGFVESLLAGTALGHNPRLRLEERSLQVQALSIPGLLNPQSQRLTIDARTLRAVLGL